MCFFLSEELEIVRNSIHTLFLWEFEKKRGEGLDYILENVCTYSGRFFHGRIGYFIDDS